ncbi:N2,N2-dimethylguanosine tRNA methyltransferase [Kwoniella dejecticola CBS 10117]|uniref:tRNA (guanine(26)-N(2))-dimethyltransferase n=1 Tax=Kwoniella dejecticola CBS 10117 TaxID=1296121 RepID=A0A1A6A5T1_9TREE|nr:N2,N2-dimethylguanosine tRNA methyltransferase [Kwoniella dejecticola CBS 10117]OBR85412.1 N2,N2-dimethylguanosine tRNA methyltransferase [Kwoniella dejecticola CBS 10117]
MSTSTTPSSEIPYTVPLKDGIPKGHTTHTESTTTIFLPKEGAFLNPVQHYNRDMSVAVIRAWNELRKEEQETKFRNKLAKTGGVPKKKKGKSKEAAKEEGGGEKAAADPETLAENSLNEQPTAGPSTERKFRPPSINILEALAATGLRSIRYAKEIPNVKFVLANDLSPSACEAMRRNVEFNGVGEYSLPPRQPWVPKSAENGDTSKAENGDEPMKEEEQVKKAEEPKQLIGEDGLEIKDKVGRRPGCRGRVKINEGDACAFMYSHRSPIGPSSRVDVVDLDPYGTAAPFIDAAIGSISDGGLLAITCTDLAVLAGQQYPEKCYSNYGGTNVHAEYTHEAALRLVLHSLATCAARYGRYITPLLSFSIDFYVRLFVRINTGPEQVKRVASKSGVVFTCNFCESSVTQPFGRIVERETSKGVVRETFKTHAGPTPKNGSNCEECGGTMHLGGPLWLGPIQDPTFAKRVITEISAQEKEYKTFPRMLGMLSLAAQELPDPFFFTANRIAKSVHLPSLPLNKILSALLNAGYKVSRSHAQAGAIKTNAPRSFIYDILREEAKTNPIRIDKIAEGSPARVLIAKAMTHTIDFTPHPDASLERTGKETFYQINPLPNWGPAPRAKSIQVNVTGPVKDNKRKVEEALENAMDSKKVKVDGTESEAIRGSVEGIEIDSKDEVLQGENQGGQEEEEMMNL